jgi:hypothetical protein
MSCFQLALRTFRPKICGGSGRWADVPTFEEGAVSEVLDAWKAFVPGDHDKFGGMTIVMLSLLAIAVVGGAFSILVAA